MLDDNTAMIRNTLGGLGDISAPVGPGRLVVDFKDDGNRNGITNGPIRLLEYEMETRFSGVEESRVFIVGSEPGLPENVPALGPAGLVVLAALLGVGARRRLRD